MTPEQTAALLAFGTDALKILGPAAIAAWASHRVTKTQSQQRIRELEASNQFTTRTTLFAFYKEELRQLSERSNETAKSIGQLVGLMAAGPSDPKVLSTFRHLARIASAQVPMEIDLVLAEMEAEGVQAQPELNALLECRARASWAEVGNTDEAVMERLFLLPGDPCSPATMPRRRS